MKDRKFKTKAIAAALVVLGILIAAGPHTLFHVCTSMTNACHYTGQAEIGVGAVLALLGVFSLFTKSRDQQRGLFLGALLVSVLSLLIVLVLVGVCPNTSMVCNREALPGLTIVGILAVLASLAGIVLQSSRTVDA